MSIGDEQQGIPCDIVLLPEGLQLAEAVRCSELLAGQGALFTLDNEHFYAHASLYMFQMDVSRQAECESVLQEIASKFKTQELVQAGYYYLDNGPGKGYVDIMFERNVVADELQQTVVTAFNLLRAGMRESDMAKMADATGLKLENLQKYGYPAVGELFRPHVTLTKFPAETEPDLSVLPSPTIFTGRFTKLGLFEMGENGTCIRRIATFDL